MARDQLGPLRQLASEVAPRVDDLRGAASQDDGSTRCRRTNARSVLRANRPSSYGDTRQSFEACARAGIAERLGLQFPAECSLAPIRTY